MGLANMGKLLTALNPLDQSAVQQLMKSTAGQGMFKRGLAFAQAGAKQVARGGYFRGRTLNYAPGRAAGPWRSLSGTRAMRDEAAVTRQAAAGVVGAWVGLNLMAPNSGLTSLANYGAMAGAGVGISRGPLMNKFGTTGRNIGYGATGVGLAAKMFGAF